MLPEKQLPSSRFAPIAYSLGLAIIFSATVLNLCLHKLPPKHLYSLPSFLTDAYEQGGNLGVTLVLGGAGLVIMALGYLSTLFTGRTSRSGGHTAVDDASTATYSDPRIDASSPATSSSGTLMLETTKYLGKKPSALPGSTVIVEEPTPPWKKSHPPAAANDAPV
jgi:hypothetical protein